MLSWVLLRTYCILSFRIPTDSMTPAIMPGDCMLGTRMGLKNIDRNDIVFFYFPYPAAWDSIGTGGRIYVKRCIGLPGDTLEIRGGRYRIRGYSRVLGNTDAQDIVRYRLSGITEDSVARKIGICLDAWPSDDSPTWTILEFGPLMIPKAGTSIVINGESISRYGNLIEWETGRKIDGKKDSGKYYTFRKNYYFVAGDNASNSQDSRYWALLPEDFILAKGLFIWKHAK